jgi:hypothetical protein
MTPEEATVQSEFGPLRLGIRAYEWQYGSYQYNRSVLLTFDEETDLERSEPVLEESRQMAFQLWSQNRLKGRVYAYLGRPYDDWDDDLAIELDYKFENDRGESVWWAEGGEKKREDEDVGRIKREYWCAAEARVSLYLRDEDGYHPIRNEDGSIIGTRVRLGYEDKYQKIYDGILEDFSRQNLRGNLASRFEQFAEFQKARQRAERSLALELYKRLRDILPRYRKVLNKIIRSPSTQISPERTNYDLSTAGADQHLSRQRPSSKMKRVKRVTEVGGKQIPVRFTNIEAQETPDTFANRFVAGFVQRVDRLIRRVKRHLEKEQEMNDWVLKRHDKAYERLETELNRFARFRRKLPVTAKGYTQDHSSLQTAELSYDSRYVRLRRLNERLDHLLDYVDVSNLPFEVEAFNTLYERWCFVRVVQALCEIGFEFVGDGGRRTTQFYKNPIPGEPNCKMYHEECDNMILEVWYDKEYNVLEREHGYYDEDRPYGIEKRGLHRSRYRGWKNRPDISLEFHEMKSEGDIVKGGVPTIFTLDPTLGSPVNSKEKYEYKDGLRHFVVTGDDGKSKKIVESAWGIWPGSPGEEEWVTEERGGGSMEHGFIHLRAEEESINKLPETIRNVLESRGIL